MGERRDREAGRGQLTALMELVLREQLGAGAGHEPMAGALERGEVGGVDPLELEGHDVDLGGERLEHGELAVVADARPRARADGGVGRRGREHGDVEVERDRRLEVHPRELPGAEDAEVRPLARGAVERAVVGRLEHGASAYAATLAMHPRPLPK